MLSNTDIKTSPKLFYQRQIIYVENAFNEQACSFEKICDKKYMQSVCETSQIFDETDSNNENNEEIWSISSRTQDCRLQGDWSCLFSPVQCQDNCPSGQIQSSLCYNPILETLKISIIKARGLTCSICSKKHRTSGIICVDTSIRVSLFLNNRELETKETAKKTSKVEIFFYDKFSFQVRQDIVGQCSLQCQAVHRVGSFLKRKHVIGKVVIGGEACYGAKEDKGRGDCWQKMVNNPNEVITQWFYLKENV